MGSELFLVSIHHGPQYLLIVATGRGEIANLRGACKLAAEIGAAKPYRRILVDLLGVTPDMSETEHQVLGKYVARELAVFERVACVIPEAFRTGVGEAAARDAGLRYKVFPNFDEATHWLEGTT